MRRAITMKTQVTVLSTRRGMNDQARRGTTRVLITLIDVPTTTSNPAVNDNQGMAFTNPSLGNLLVGSQAPALRRSYVGARSTSGEQGFERPRFLNVGSFQEGLFQSTLTHMTWSTATRPAPPRRPPISVRSENAAS